MTTRILVVGPAWVGDMVMAQALFKSLKWRRSATEIDVLAPGYTAALLERMPEVRAAITAPYGHGELNLKARRKQAKHIGLYHYDQAIVLPNSLKSALIPYWAKIPRRTGYTGEVRYGLLNDRRYLDKQKLPRMVQRFVALAAAKNAEIPDIPYPHLAVSAESVAAALSKHQLNCTKPIFILCPGAEFGPAKRWPTQHFATVAQTQLVAGYQVWLMGSAKEAPLAAVIQAASGNGCVDLCGKTSLAEAIDLMSLAAGVCTNDSGLMHIAAALAVPVVAVYGSSSPIFTPPLSKQVRIVHNNLPCSPCFKRTCPLGHTNCLQQLKPQKVLAAFNELSA